MSRNLYVAAAIAAVLALSGCKESRTDPNAKPEQAVAGAAAASIDQFAAMNELAGFRVGVGANGISMPQAYVLFDPQCSHCAHLWDAAKPLQSKVLIKWIPVGLLNGMSGPQGARLLEAADPVGLMNANEAAMLNTGRPSTETVKVADATLDKVKANTMMLVKLKATSVPTIVYRDPKTKNMEIVSGARPTEALAEMFGIADATQ